MTVTKADLLASAERLNIPLRTTRDVRASIASAEKAGTGQDMARLLLRHGRLSKDARKWLGDYLWPAA